MKNNPTQNLDFHKDFIKEANIKLVNLVNELHILYSRRNIFAEIIDKYKDYYTDRKININNIYNIDDLKRIIITENSDLDNKRLSYLKSYNYIVSDRIPFVIKKINIYSKFKNTPFYIFVSLQRRYNLEVANYIIKGNSFKIGKYLSNIRLNIYKAVYSKIDWGETNKLKKEILAANKDIFTKDNKKGIHYLMKHENDDMQASIVWNKKNCKVENSKFYKFNSISNRNVMVTRLEPNSIDDIFNNTKLSMVEKLSAVRIHFPNHIKSLYKYE